MGLRQLVNSYAFNNEVAIPKSGLSDAQRKTGHAKHCDDQIWGCDSQFQPCQAEPRSQIRRRHLLQTTHGLFALLTAREACPVGTPRLASMRGLSPIAFSDETSPEAKSRPCAAPRWEAALIPSPSASLRVRLLVVTQSRPPCALLDYAP